MPIAVIAMLVVGAVFVLWPRPPIDMWEPPPQEYTVEAPPKEPAPVDIYQAATRLTPVVESKLPE